MNMRIARKLWNRMHDEDAALPPRTYLGRRAIVRLCRGRHHVVQAVFGTNLGELKKAWNAKKDMSW